MHTTEEADAHDAVKQLVKLTRLEGVASSDPKLIPDTVTLHPAVATALSSAMKLTEGAAQRDSFENSNNYEKNTANGKGCIYCLQISF